MKGTLSRGRRALHVEHVLTEPPIALCTTCNGQVVRRARRTSEVYTLVPRTWSSNWRVTHV
eukprot:831509-Prymnesium_polylepis.2